MKRRLGRLYWLGILITLAMAFVAIGVAVKLKLDDTRASLTALLKTATRWTLDSNEDLHSLADEIARVSPPLRVTFMLDSGVILADSVADADPGAGHYDDAEIAAARAGGIGRDVRVSATNATFVLYMAQRVSPQLILRLSYPVLEVARLLAVYGAAVLALFLVLYLVQRRAIARFAADQVRQLEDVRRLLDGETEEVRAVFPELGPSLDAIAYRARRLREDYGEVVRTLRLRSDFVAHASHELRSPLTSVRGYAELLEEGLADTEEERALCLSTIREECDRMLEVIEAILRLSRAEQEPAAPAAPIPAAPVAREVIRALRPQAEKKAITLSAEGEALLPVPERELWEILYNLADNAVRYGRRGGSVRVILSPGRAAVRDDGPGIPPEHLGHIFEQFYRVDAAPGGTGLGLSIVRALVERNGGTVSVDSRVGEGTTFTVAFGEESGEGAAA